MKLTPSTRAEWAKVALSYLRESAAWKTEHSDLTRECLRAYGDHGPLISGVVRDHFPELLKNRLRDLARERTRCLDRAVVCWRASGRRMSTLRREIANLNA